MTLLDLNSYHEGPCTVILNMMLKMITRKILRVISQLPVSFEGMSVLDFGKKLKYKMRYQVVRIKCGLNLVS